MPDKSWTLKSMSWPCDTASLMYYSLILLAISIPLSEFGMSLAQFLLLGFWIFDNPTNQKTGTPSQSRQTMLPYLIRNMACKFRMLFNNPAALVVVSFYLLHIIGLLYTSNLNYALKDLRIKLPLLSIPIIIATSAPLSLKRFHRLLVLFVLAVFAGTMASMYVLFTRHISDPRELSIFISHIRFSLTICLSVFILIYFIAKKIFHLKLSLFLMVSGIVWFLVFLLILESITGILITIILGLIFLIYYIFRFKSIALKIIFTAILIPGLLVSYNYINKVVNEFRVPVPVDFSRLEKYTEFGAPYIHDTSTYGTENGEYVGLYISVIELRYEWNLRSDLDFDGLDLKGQELKYTLIRYLYSKNLRKNALAVRSLTDKEINYIENGIANARYVEHFNLASRIEQMAMGYHNYTSRGDPNASSLMQRIEYWKASVHIIKNNLLIGVGTGDLNEAFDQAYVDLDSKLDDSFRKRSHNQFLAITIAFGIFGFLWFVFTLIYPGIKVGKFNDYFYVVFFIIIILSMLTEDTLETQAGATLFAFFNALLLFGRSRKTSEESANA
ncbi:MAG: O-antigen ligase family protein [Lentimicrobium sp.]|nr:O-antigen ligase family protein [Lentimicrobium sp.]